MLLWTYDHPLHCLFISVSQVFYYSSPFIIFTKCSHLQIPPEDSKHHLFIGIILYPDKKLFLPWFLLLNMFQICDNIFTSYRYLRFLHRSLSFLMNFEVQMFIGSPPSMVLLFYINRSARWKGFLHVIAHFFTILSFTWFIQHRSWVSWCIFTARHTEESRYH